jgi:hypothetical protein
MTDKEDREKLNYSICMDGVTVSLSAALAPVLNSLNAPKILWR